MPCLARPLISIAMALPTICAAEGHTNDRVACPAMIQQSAIRILDAPIDWTSFVALPLYLHGAAPMSGPPEQLGELAGFHEARVKGKLVHTYKFDGKYPEGKWLACTYGESDQVKLSKRLPDAIRTCSFTYSKGTHVGQVNIAIFCT